MLFSTLIFAYLQKLWRCDPFSIPRVGHTHQPASHHLAAACCSPCLPPEVLHTTDLVAGLSHLHKGCHKAAPHPAVVLLLGRAAVLLMLMMMMIMHNTTTFLLRNTRAGNTFLGCVTFNHSARKISNVKK